MTVATGLEAVFIKSRLRCKTAFKPQCSCRFNHQVAESNRRQPSARSAMAFKRKSLIFLFLCSFTERNRRCRNRGETAAAVASVTLALFNDANPAPSYNEHDLKAQ